MSATQITENVQGDLVEAELPVTDPRTDTLAAPVWFDGEGIATEIIVINTSETASAGSLRLMSADGQPEEMILR